MSNVNSISTSSSATAVEGMFGSFVNSIAARLSRDGQYSTANNYLASLRSFMCFRDGNDIPLAELDAKVIQSYEAWLKGRGVCRNTSSFYMRVLRAAYNSAVESGLVTRQRLFANVYTGIDKTRKRAIDLNTVKAIKQFDSDNPSVVLARDMFVLSFCLRGMSFVDMANLRKSNLRDGYLHYVRSKTGQRLCVRWEQQMQEIVGRHSSLTESSDYLLPILVGEGDKGRLYKNVQSRIAYNLNKIAKCLGLQGGLTLYVARHSWATIARDSNVPLSVISEALGHDSEITTQIYLQSIKMDEVDRANASILDNL